MQTRSRLLPAISLATIFTLAAFIGGCATGGGTDEPTVPVVINTTPLNKKIYVDDIPVATSPTTVNLIVNADGKLAYDVDITADFSNRAFTMAESGLKPIYIRLRTGETPPARINFDQRTATRVGESLVVNPPGTRSSAVGRVGSRDPESIAEMIALRNEAPAAEPMAMEPAAPAGGGARGGAPAGGARGGGGGARGGQ